MSVQKKVVFVTGCSQGGIGASIVEEFASRGCIVYATARTLSSMESLSAAIHKLQLDVLNKESCESVVKTILDKEGRIDILVNNAGAGGAGPCLEFDIDAAQAVFAINLLAPMRLAQLCVPSMANHHSGLVINIGSIVGKIPTPWAGVYASSKAAIHSYSETLRLECEGLGVKVMLVAPGAITSNFGTKQEESCTMIEGTLFESARAAIEARAKMSQRPDHSLPSSILATGIVDRALSANPPATYTAGGKATLFSILEWLPRSLVWWILKKQTGCDQVKLMQK